MKTIISLLAVFALLPFTVVADTVEKRVDNITDVWVHVHAYAANMDGGFSKSYTFVTFNPQTKEIGFVDIGAVPNGRIKVLTDVPADQPMWVMYRYSGNSFSGYSWEWAEIHIRDGYSLSASPVKDGKNPVPATHALAAKPATPAAKRPVKRISGKPCLCGKK